MIQCSLYLLFWLGLCFLPGYFADHSLLHRYTFGSWFIHLFWEFRGEVVALHLPYQGPFPHCPPSRFFSSIVFSLFFLGFLIAFTNYDFLTYQHQPRILDTYCWWPATPWRMLYTIMSYINIIKRLIFFLWIFYLFIFSKKVHAAYAIYNCKYHFYSKIYYHFVQFLSRIYHQYESMLKNHYLFLNLHIASYTHQSFLFIYENHLRWAFGSFWIILDYDNLLYF